MDPVNIRGLFDFNYAETLFRLMKLKSVDSIVRRFKTGALCHTVQFHRKHIEALAVAMNRLHANRTG